MSTAGVASQMSADLVLCAGRVRMDERSFVCMRRVCGDGCASIYMLAASARTWISVGLWLVADVPPYADAALTPSAPFASGFFLITNHKINSAPISGPIPKASLLPKGIAIALSGPATLSISSSNP